MASNYDVHSPPEIRQLLKGALSTTNHLAYQPSFISISQQNIFLNKIILLNIPTLIYKQFFMLGVLRKNH
jgi:hypothetical protein